MGYGENLKKHLNEKGIKVSELSKLTGISKNSIYTIFKRDSPVRYDQALKISYALNIPVSDICNTDPYKQGLETEQEDEEKKKAEMEDSFHRCFINKKIIPVLIGLGKDSKDNLPEIAWFLEQYSQLWEEERNEVILFMEFMSEKHKRKSSNR